MKTNQGSVILFKNIVLFEKRLSECSTRVGACHPLWRHNFSVASASLNHYNTSFHGDIFIKELDPCCSLNKITIEKGNLALVIEL